MIGLYYVLLAYADLGEELRLTKRYEKEYMEITAESFFMRGLKPSDVVTDSKRQRKQPWAVPAAFCAMGYINLQRYLPGVEQSMETRKQRPRLANVELRAAHVKSRKEHRIQQEVQVVSLRVTRDGEKLFQDYGMNYKFEYSNIIDKYKNGIK